MHMTSETEKVIAYGVLRSGPVRINIVPKARKFFVQREEFVRTTETEDDLAVFRPKKK